MYNADSGFFNTLADIGHKIFSPNTYECSLCMITHSYFSEYSDWQNFIKNLKINSIFLHRNQFREQFPSNNAALPAIFIQNGPDIELFIDSVLIENCKNFRELTSLIQNRMEHELIDGD